MVEGVECLAAALAPKRRASARAFESRLPAKARHGPTSAPSSDSCKACRHHRRAMIGSIQRGGVEEVR